MQQPVMPKAPGDVYEFRTPAAGSEHNEGTTFTASVLAPTRDPDLYRFGYGIIPPDPITPITITILADPPTQSNAGPNDPPNHKIYSSDITAPAVDADSDMLLQFLYRDSTSAPYTVKADRTVRIKNV